MIIIYICRSFLSDEVDGAESNGQSYLHALIVPDESFHKSPVKCRPDPYVLPQGLPLKSINTNCLNELFIQVSHPLLLLKHKILSVFVSKL
jgi:hypothetical protein